MPDKKLILNNEYYLFPENSFAVNYGNRFCVFINGAAVESLSEYKVTKEKFNRKRTFSYLKQAPHSYVLFSNQYDNIAEFLAKNQNMSYLQFDSKTCEDMILFSFLPKLDFANLDAVLELVANTMPFMLNIFVHPIVRLTPEEVIVPVDAVKKINQKTIQHILRHSEHWKSTDDNKIKPARLLTNVYEDDYTTYENKVFCATVDQVISVLNEYKNFFTDIIYNKLSFELNFMDKSNHLYHFLALGKLYVGFVKSDELFAERCNDYIEKFNKIINKLSGHKVRNIYKYNRKAQVKLPVMKTNILAFHKDYSHIYTLKRVLDKSEEIIDWNALITKFDSLQTNYANFCFMLTIFSVAHFRFTTNEKRLYEKGKFTGAFFSFEKWRINLAPATVKCLNSDAMLMTVVCGGLKHVTLLIPTISELDKDALIEGLLKDISKEHKADNYVFFTPAKSKNLPSYRSETPMSCGILPILINDINSFKRIQKLLLTAMITVSEQHDICPFCGGNFEPKADGYYCKKCKTELHNTVCASCNQPFRYTSINYPALKKRVVDKRNYTWENYWKYYNDKDSQLNYRNITDLTADGLPVCPHCNKNADSKTEPVIEN